MMPDQVAVATRRQRLQRLLSLATASSQAFRRRHLGRVLPVLWEEAKRGRWQGLTANYLRVYTRADEDLTNKLLPVRLLDLEAEGLSGQPEPVGRPQPQGALAS